MRKESLTRQWLGPIIIFVVVMLAVVGLIFGLSVGYMVSEADTIRATVKQGYQDIQIKERHNFFADYHGCGNDDDVAFEARAKNPKGEEVDIIICAGWPFKGVTVRTK